MFLLFCFLYIRFHTSFNMHESFVSYLINEKRSSPHTVEAYRNDLLQFASFLKFSYETEDVSKATHQQIRSWIASMLNEKYDSRSVNRKLSTLKTYFKFLKREGSIEKNPMLKVVAPKTSKKLPVFVEEAKMDLLLDEIAFEEGFEGQRDKLIIELFYFSGIRLSELMGIKETDIDYHNLSLKVLGKRSKERIIPLPPVLLTKIRTFQTLRKEAGIDNPLLFTTKKGEKTYPKLVYNIVNHYLSQVTSLTKKSPHVIRHTFATTMLNNGADLNAIKELLGHANLSATQVYTHNTFEKIKNIYKQAHPRA